MNRETLAIVLTAAAAALLVLAVGRALSARMDGLVRHERLRRRVGLPVDPIDGAVTLRDGPEHGGWSAVGRMLAPRSPAERRAVQARLLLAGFRRDADLGIYFVLKYGAAVTVLAGGLALALLERVAIQVPFIAAAAALFLPDLLLRSAAARRLARIDRALPDFIDLCNIAMSAGLNWLAGVSRVSAEVAELHPELSREFRFMLDQAQAGLPRTEALRQLALRNPTPDIQQLVQILVQNEQLGSAVSDSLAGFSRRLYAEREQRMEEKAGKVSAKMALVIMPFMLLPFMLLLVGERLVGLLRGLS